MFRRGLIVSCQASEDNPLHGPAFMAAMAQAAAAGGAIAIRANGPDDVTAIKRRVGLPIIGLWKREVEGFAPYITPTLESAEAIAEAGADLIALDATLRPHPEGTMQALLKQVKDTLGLPVFADVATLEDGVAAARAGAAYLSTTMAGYTPDTVKTDEPDFALLRDLVKAVDIPVVAEGRFWTPEQVGKAFDLGAFAVVIGTAITNPLRITERFARVVPK